MSIKNISVDQALYIQGRSMEPILFNDDLVQFSSMKIKDLQIGKIYAYEYGNSYIAHRFVGRTENFFLFQGDRQPEPELVSFNNSFFELKRILVRRKKPKASRIVLGVLKNHDKFCGWHFPLNISAFWPWDEMDRFCIKFGLSEIFYGSMASCYIIENSSRPLSKAPLISEKLTLKDIKNVGLSTFYLYNLLKKNPKIDLITYFNLKTSGDFLILNRALYRINEWWNENFPLLPNKNIVVKINIRYWKVNTQMNRIFNCIYLIIRRCQKEPNVFKKSFKKVGAVSFKKGFSRIKKMRSIIYERIKTF